MYYPMMARLKGAVNGQVLDVLKVVHIERRLKEAVILVQIQNSWDSFKWEGDWSNDSELWTEDVKKKINFKPSTEVFWMSLEDFCKEFDRFGYCRFEDQWKYTITDSGHE